jgi:hypothetical protein
LSNRDKRYWKIIFAGILVNPKWGFIPNMGRTSTRTRHLTQRFARAKKIAKHTREAYFSKRKVYEQLLQPLFDEAKRARTELGNAYNLLKGQKTYCALNDELDSLVTKSVNDASSLDDPYLDVCGSYLEASPWDDVCSSPQRLEAILPEDVWWKDVLELDQ